MSDLKKVKIIEIGFVTHDVMCFVVEKPDDFTFTPGQATTVRVAKEGWEDEERPFTFTSLNRDPMLEFTIKIYPERDGVTDKLAELKVGDELLVGDAWGAIEYQGPGTFIAGGAGITPFIAILRNLHAQGGLAGNRLIFSNEKVEDVILACELRRMLGDDALFTLTDDSNMPEHYSTERITEDFLREKLEPFPQNFYVCGPPEMVEDVTESLKKLGVADEKIVTESA